MADSAFPHDVAVVPAVDRQMQQRVRRLVWKIAIATWVLMAIGSATRVMNAGLACPDWPLCYGQLVPARLLGNLQVFLEWFHRLDASVIGLSAIVLVLLSWWQRQQLPRWVPGAAAIALLLIVGQGVLGGLTVTQLLRFDIVMAHLGTALLFFSWLIGMGVLLLPAGDPIPSQGRWQALGAIAALLVYVQSLIGALVGSRWAAHQCLVADKLCTQTYAHLLAVIPTTAIAIFLAVAAWKSPALPAGPRRLALLAGGLTCLQVILGMATYRLHLQVEPLTVAHQTIGAALLGVLVAFSVRIWQSQSQVVPTTY
ncbi:MAG: heme A synthase [Cyanobacteria bacterium J06641_5]